MALNKLPKEKRQWIKDTAQEAVKYASSDMDGEEAVKKAVSDEDMGAGESRLVCQIFNNFRLIDQYEKGSSLEEKIDGPKAVDFRDVNSDLFDPEQRKEAVDKHRNKIASDWYEKNASAKQALQQSSAYMTKAAETKAPSEETGDSRSSIFSDTSSLGQDKISEYNKDKQIEKLMYNVETLESDIMRKRAILDDLTIGFQDAIEKAAEAVSGHEFSEVETRIKTDLDKEAYFVMDKVANKINPSSRGAAKDELVINDYEEEPYQQIKEAAEILQGIKQGKERVEQSRERIKVAGREMLKLSNYSKGTMNWLERHGAVNMKGANSELTLGESFLSDKEAGIFSGLKTLGAAKEGADLAELFSANPNLSDKEKRNRTAKALGMSKRKFRKKLREMENTETAADELGVGKEEFEGIMDDIKGNDSDSGDSKAEVVGEHISSFREAVKEKIPELWEKGWKSPAQAIQEFGMGEVPEDYSGLGQDFVNEIRKLQLKDFVQRIKTDDTLSGYTNREIADVINDLIETEPSIVYKPMLGVSVVKKLLEGGRYMEPQEIAELTDKAHEDPDERGTLNA